MTARRPVTLLTDGGPHQDRSPAAPYGPRRVNRPASVNREVTAAPLTPRSSFVNRLLPSLKASGDDSPSARTRPAGRDDPTSAAACRSGQDARPAAPRVQANTAAARPSDWLGALNRDARGDCYGARAGAALRGRTGPAHRSRLRKLRRSCDESASAAGSIRCSRVQHGQQILLRLHNAPRLRKTQDVKSRCSHPNHCSAMLITCMKATSCRASALSLAGSLHRHSLVAYNVGEHCVMYHSIGCSAMHV